jgi:RES domain-containing protein
VTAQILDRTMRAYRIGDPNGRYPIMDATGSTLYPGRWNTPSTPLLYCSEHYSTNMLEKLVHGGRLPPNQHFVEITVDAGASYEVFPTAAHPGWDAAIPTVSQTYGSHWVTSQRSLILLAPSVVARMEKNVMINPAHPEFAAKVHVGLHEPVYWDGRLFNRP